MADGGTAIGKRRKPRLEAAPTTPDPIEIAMEAEAGNPATDSPARTLLINQNRLVLRQIANERMGLVLKWLIALAAVAAAALLAVMAWSASQDRSLVIDAFSVPADFVEQGSSGQAVASALQDRLAQLSAQTQGVIATPELRQLSAASVKVQIPQTGISISELDELLHRWLGDRTVVAGEVAHVVSGADKGALAMNLRVGQQPGVRLVQPDGDMQTLLQRAAEHVYGARAPNAYANWLNQNERPDEAIALARRLAERGSRDERAEGYGLIAALAGPSITPAERIGLYRQGLRLQPGVGSSVINLAAALSSFGQSEEAYHLYVQASKIPAPIRSNETGRALWPQLARSNIGSITGDYSGNLQMMCWLYDVSPCQSNAFVATALLTPRGARAENSANRLGAATANLADAHDVAAAAQLASHRPIQTGAKTGVAARLASWMAAEVAIDREREDWPGLVRDADAWNAFAADWPGLRGAQATWRVWRSYALVKLGRAAEGQVDIDATPLDCYPCLIMRGRIAALAGDRPGAERWFGEARRIGPSLPMADLAWGEALLGLGEPDRAIAHFAAAQQSGPKFADPLVRWGEALLAKGDAAGAAAKFEAANAFTPNWGRLHLKWSEALATLGKAEEARAQFRAALGRYLTPSERAEHAAASRKQTL